MIQLSQKYYLQTCSFSYFSNCRRRATAILSVMQLSQIFFLQTCFFPKSVPTEDMRRPYSLWFNNSPKKSYLPVVSPTSIFTEEKRTPYSVWCNFSQKNFTDLFFFLIQYLQRKCNGHTQCDSIILKKSLRYVSFLLVQFLQRTCKRSTQCEAIFSKVLFTDLFFFLIQKFQKTCDGHTQCDAITLEKKSYISVVSPTSVFREVMRTPYSVWCNFLKSVFSELFFYLIQYLQRTCDLHSQCVAFFSNFFFYRSAFFSNSVIAEDM